MPVVLAGLILAFLLMMLFGDSELDRSLLVLLDGDGLPRLREVAEAVLWLAQPLPLFILVLVAVGAILIARQWLDAALLLGITLAGWLAILALQHVTLPLRPLEGMSRAVGAPYPNAAAAGVTIAAFAAAFLGTRRPAPRAWALGGAWLFALLTGVAAIMAARAWPSGVVGGWAFGLAWTLIILLCARADIGDGERVR